MSNSIRTASLLVLALSASSGACASSGATAGARSGASAAPSAGDNSANALDWAGVYLGTLPCADCEGIETAILLRPDGTYQIATKYLVKPAAAKAATPAAPATPPAATADAKPATPKPGELQVQHGKFTWNSARNQITFVGVTDGPSRYLVGENQLVQLDLEGNRITGPLADRYVLQKQSVKASSK